MLNILFVPFTNIYFLGNLLSYTALLSLSGLGIFVAYKGGAFNLGGEGQIYFGSFVGVVFALYIFPHDHLFFSKVGIFFISFLVGGVVASLSGYLKYYFKVSEFISSFLISEVFLILTNFLLRVKFRDPSYGITATLPLSKGLLFEKILPPSSLTISIFISLFLVILGIFVFHKTIYGYEFRIFGYSPRFAFYGGMKPKRQIILPLFISGGLLALSGVLDILSRDGRFVQGFSYGLGWDGIVVSLLSRGNPLWIIPAALLLSYIKVFSQVGGIYGVFPSEAGDILKAILFLFLTIGAFSYLGEKDV